MKLTPILARNLVCMGVKQKVNNSTFTSASSYMFCSVGKHLTFWTCLGSEDACKDDNTTPLGKDLKPECQNRDANITNEAVDNNYVLVNSSREAIDLIGAFHNYPNCSSEGISKFDSLPQLDLSLRRCHFIGFCNSYTEEMRTLGHSNASAFTRWVLVFFFILHYLWLVLNSYWIGII